MKKKIIMDGVKMLWRTMVILALVEMADIYVGLVLGTALGDFTEQILVYDISGSLCLAARLLLCVLVGALVLPSVGLFGNYLLFRDALRHDRFIFDQYFRMPYEMQRKVSLGEVQYRVENDPNQFRLILVFMVKYIVCTVVSLPALIVVLGKIDPAMLLTVAVLSIVKWLASEKMGRLSAKGIQAEREFNTGLRKYEMDISGHPAVFTAFRWEEGACSKIHEEASTGFRNLLSKTFWGRAVSASAGMVATTLYPLLVLLAGCIEMGRQKISLSDILAVLVIFPVVEKVINMVDYCVKNRKSLDDVLERMTFFYRAEDCKSQTGFKGGVVDEIMVRALSYAYDDTPVLENCSLTINHKKTAVCGKNGSGKSTLIKILCGFLQDYQGDVCIGKENLKGREDEWFHCFAYIPQEPFLFAESLERNIAMSEDYNDEAVRQLTALTGLSRLVGKEISNDSVSGGERQRIALARALYCGREWFFMDEPTNNLDADTIEWLKDFIHRTDKTLVFVTHDRGLAEEAEEVIELGERRDGDVSVSGRQGE